MHVHIIKRRKFSHQLETRNSQLV